MHFQKFRARVIARALTLCAACAAHAVLAQTPTVGWQVGAAIDVSAASRALALGHRDQGLGLGHSDVTASGPLGQALEARITGVAHTFNQKLETEIEEAWVQTRKLPAGLQLRTGRFASQIGYLNEQHPHTDDFVQRPLLHRAFLGSHWTDDGLRLNWTAPTDLYLRMGVEVLRGRRLVEEAASSQRPGAVTYSGRLGGDIGRNQSWQAGLSLLQNRREAAVEEEDHAAHAHGASYSGRRMWLGDVTWKWAPQGNNRQQQVRVSLEHAVIKDLNRYATDSDRHHATYLSAVWRFAPGWETGVRVDQLRVRDPHEESFEDGRLREAALMLAYKPSHAHTLRVQFSRQKDRGGFADATRALQIQYVMHLGAHAAHAY
jgi:hypothetical protein